MPAARIVLCTLPIRDQPTVFPPFGAMALIESLRRAGFDPMLYDLDVLRPSLDEAVRVVAAERPDLIAISAVVSTAYAAAQQLTRALKSRLPGVPIIVGGNLAASAELLLRRGGIDLCGIGEGERTIVETARAVARSPGAPIDPDAFRAIPGLALLDRDGEMIFTGYAAPIPAEEFTAPAFAILERFSRIDAFIRDPLSQPDFARDPRTHQAKRRGQKLATVLASKGCVSRCTFCHRWDKGYRHWPVDQIIRQIENLRSRYNVGFFNFGDENFGADRRRLDELIARIKPLDILYQVGGVRCRTVDRDVIGRLKDSGCVAMYFGMETGSPAMLSVMEKNATLEENRAAARWMHEAGLYTIFQLVLGMPGETHATIAETIAFVKTITEDLPEPPHRRLSINYVQSLPGTPVYEYARRRGNIGPTLDDEERYLLGISNIDANDDTRLLNLTEFDDFTVQSWRTQILFEAEAHYYRRRSWKPAPAPPAADAERDYYTQGGFFNVKRLVHSPVFYRYGFWLRPLYYAAYVLTKSLLRLPFKRVLRNAGQWILIRRRQRRSAGGGPLRRQLDAEAVAPQTASEKNMLELRRGR